jgi:carboxyl-terminal processing protease
MSRTLKTALLCVSTLLVGFVFASRYSVRASDGGTETPYKQLRVFTDVLLRIDERYVEQPDMPAVTNGALHGLLESLDSESGYMTPEEYRQYLSQKDGAAGIGAVVSKRAGYAIVVSVLPGGAAAKAGVENGDILESVDGKNTHDLPLPLLRAILSGEAGSKVNLSLIRARKVQPVKLVVTREAARFAPISFKMLDDKSGYLKVGSLNSGRAEEISAAIRQLQGQGAQRLVLDLRGCAWGDPAEGIAVANLFLDKGLIATLQGQTVAKQSFSADPAKRVTALPLAVLIDRSTAGAAEIVAAAIAGNQRGIVTGEKSFGTGSTQKLIPLEDGSAILLSVAKYYTPAGKAIQDTPLTPEIAVANPLDDYYFTDSGEEGAPAEELQPKKKDADEVLKKALEALKSKKAA